MFSSGVSCSSLVLKNAGTALHGTPEQNSGSEKKIKREKKILSPLFRHFLVYITQCSPRNTAPVWENLNSLHARGDEQLGLGSTSRQEKVETSWVVQANALLYPKVAFWCLKQVLQPKPKRCLSCVSKTLAACWCLVWGRWVWELLTRHQSPQREPEVCENSPPFFFVRILLLFVRILLLSARHFQDPKQSPKAAGLR